MKDKEYQRRMAAENQALALPGLSIVCESTAHAAKIVAVLNRAEQRGTLDFPFGVQRVNW